MAETPVAALRTAANNAIVFLDGLIETGVVKDVIFHEGERIAYPVDAPLDPTQPWDAQMEDVRDALREALIKIEGRNETGGVG